MLVYFARSGARHPVLPVALGLVIGGSVSNLADRVRLGFVTDFLDFRYWPAFNLADSFIVIGVGILLAALVLAEREPRASRALRGQRDRRPARGRGRAARPLSRRAAGRRVARRRRAASRGRRRARGRADSRQEPQARRRGGARDRARRCRPRRSRTSSRPSSTIAYADEHLLVVDKPAGVVVHPAPGHAGGTLAQALAAAGAEGGEEDAARDRPPPRPRHLRAARRRALARDLRAAAAARPAPCADPRVPRARRGHAAFAARDDRRADRPRQARPPPALARHRHAARGGDALRARGAPRAPRAPARPARDGRTHQIRVHLAAIDLPVAGDRVYGAQRARSGAAVPPRGAARLRAPGTGAPWTSRRRCRPTSPPRSRRPRLTFPASSSLLPGGPAVARVPLVTGGAPRLPPAQHDKTNRKEFHGSLD